MADADIFLGVDDDAPVIERQLLGPDGLPVDHTGATTIILISPELTPGDPFEGDCSFVGDPAEALCRFPWTDFDSAEPGRYLARFKSTLGSGKKMSFPNDRLLIIQITDDP